MSALLPELNAYYRQAGAACAGELRCLKCERKRVCNGDDGARYLQAGWPWCCGGQMLLVTERELAAERAAGGGR